MQYLLLYCSPNPRFFIGILSEQKTFKHEVWARSACSLPELEIMWELPLGWSQCSFKTVQKGFEGSKVVENTQTLIPSSARWESSGKRHYQLFLQCTQTHSRESLVHPGICNSSKITLWWMLQPLFCSSPSHLWQEEKEPVSSSRMKGWRHSTWLCTDSDRAEQMLLSQAEIQILVHK